MVLKKHKDDILAIILGIGFYIVTLTYSKSFFYVTNYDSTIKSKLLHVCIEIILFLILTYVIKGIIKIVKNIKSYKDYIISFFIYYGIQIIFLALTWPGIWRWDDMIVAYLAKSYILVPWQHILSSIFYIMCMRVLPFFSGIIVIQTAIISVIVSYIVNYTFSYFNLKNNVWKVLLFIPFLLPATIDSNLYPLRCTLYSYIVLLLIFNISKYIKNDEKIDFKSCVSFIILFVITSTWRSECIYFSLVSVIFSIYMMYRKKISKWLGVVLSIITIIGTLGITELNNSCMEGTSSTNYKITATVELVAPLVRECYNQNENYDLVETIDKVIDTRMIIENPNSLGISLYWMGIVRPNYTQEDYEDYMKAYYKLCIKYYKVALKQRLEEFTITSALVKDESNVLMDSSTGFDNITDDGQDPYSQFIHNSQNFEKPLNSKLRTSVIRILEGRELDNYWKTNSIYYIFWNLVLPIAILSIGVIYLFFEKKIMLSFILCTLLCKTALVFITAPSPYFMYYFLEYMTGYLLLAIAFIVFFKRRIDGREN